jgi:hypothetical protein
MHFVFLGYTPNGSQPMFVFPPKPLVKLHSALHHLRWPVAFDVLLSSEVDFD